MSKEDHRNNEQVLSENQYLFCCDTTKGVTHAYTGPKVVTITGQEYPVIYDHESNELVRTNLGNAVKHNILATQGQYVEVVNPPKDNKFPDDNSKENVPELLMGEKVNIPGPISFALWPGVSVNVIGGHQLRSNQYLLLRVYDENLAKKHWASAIIKTVETIEDEEGNAITKTAQDTSDVKPEEFAVGKLFIIKGTEVSFFIPPTGVEVVQDEETGAFVRQALTLASLQYAILLDESGQKYFHHGPKVVFPKPTETFYSTRDSNGQAQRMFRNVELNEIQGLHIKVIEEYQEGSRTYKKGEELFLTGKDTPIYFPRHEHSIIRYDGRDKHYAIAIPSGEARYVMERKSGIIRREVGPKMLLVDPRTEVIVRRVLTMSQCEYWYPGNTEAKAYNAQLSELARRAPTTRKGVVSEGEYERSVVRRSRSKSKSSEVLVAGASAHSATNSLPDLAMELSRVNHDNSATMPDQFTRGSSYSEPRSITMNSKFEGVPTIEPYNGYAVLVISKSGDRRVVEGPQTIPLEYDETLEVLSFSTGKPKNTDNLHRTVYLRVRNNQVSDKVWAETKDHVRVSVTMSYKVNFEGESQDDRIKWFSVDNYIKHLCDHARSRLKSSIRQLTLDEFYNRSTEVVRGTLLGEREEEKGRTGLFFEENNMRLNDVEVLNVVIDDQQIAAKFKEAQIAAVESSITITKAKKALEVVEVQEDIKRQRLGEYEKTVIAEAEQKSRDLQREVERLKAEHQKALDVLNQASEAKEKEEANTDFVFQKQVARSVEQNAKNLELKKSEQNLQVAMIKEETKAMVEKAQAIGGPLSEAIVALQNEETLVKVAQATSINEWLGVDSLVEVLKGHPMEAKLQSVFAKALKEAPKQSKEA